ncbi:MAG: transporter substrate-binding domain-containing protein [Erysipelotrichaceae bacterium]|nr:transporter substrate-binding domain-containing protein [Erysipelotrichaceae bacterium]
MKKLLTALLALLLVFSLAACGSKPADEGGEGGETPAEPKDEYDEVMQRGTLIVGVEGTYSPYTFHGDNGELTGFDVDVANAIAERMGIKIDFVEAEWDSLLVGVDTGRLDTVINDVGITAERKEKYDYAGPVLYHIQNVYVLKDNNDIHGLEDLDGKRLATNITGAMVPYFESLGVQIVGISTSEEAQNLLQRGDCDFLSTYPEMMEDYWKQHPEARENTKIAFALTDYLTMEGIPFRKGETRLRDAVEAALEEMRKDGTLGEISVKWFGVDQSVLPEGVDPSMVDR